MDIVSPLNPGLPHPKKSIMIQATPLRRTYIHYFAFLNQEATPLGGNSDLAIMCQYEYFIHYKNK